MTKTATALVSGLAQGPSPYTALPPGTLSVADNCVVRRKGVLTPLPAQTSVASAGGSTDPVKLLCGWSEPYFAAIEKPGTPGVNGTVLALHGPLGDDSYTTVPFGSTSRTFSFKPGQTHATFARNRHIFTDGSSPIAVDASPTLTHGHGAPRPVGLPSPVSIELTASLGGSKPLPAFQLFGYRALFKRKLVSDGANFEIVSAPTYAAAASLSGIATTPLVTVTWDVVTPVVVGDYVTLYRTAAAASIDALGDDYRQVAEFELQAADISARFIDIIDNTTDANRASGAQLYTNSLQQGNGQANLMPPTSTDVASFADVVFYAVSNSWPNAQLQLIGQFGHGAETIIATPRTQAFGRRLFNGSATVGSAVITGISATDIVGLLPEQYIENCAAFPNGAYVRFTSSNTVTADRNSAANTGVFTFAADDMVRFSATGLPNASITRLVRGTAHLASNTINNVDNADIAQIAIGHTVSPCPAFPLGATVTAVSYAGPYNITLNQTSAVETASFMFSIVDSTGAPSTAIANDGLSQFARNIASVAPGMRLGLVGNYSTEYTAMSDTNAGFQLSITAAIPGIYSSFSLLTSSPANVSNAKPVTTLGVVKSTQDTLENRIWFSKSQLPEAVTAAGYFDVGQEQVLKMWATQSALFAFCSDGLYRITGSGTNWATNQVDRTATLIHPDCVCALDNQVYAWLTDGIARVGEDGTQTISTDAIGPTLKGYADIITTANRDSFLWGPCMTGDNYYKEVWLNIANVTTAPARTWYNTYIFNNETGAFTSASYPGNSAFKARQGLVYAPYAQRTVSADSLFYYLPSTTDWERANVRFNPIVGDDFGKLKQWVDVNLLVENLQFSNGGTAGSVVAIFVGGETPRLITAAEARQSHWMVPRARAVRESLTAWWFFDSNAGSQTYFELHGFSSRFRPFSETIKR
jgi:hypothetical protein